MRSFAIGMVLGVCCVAGSFGCGAMQAEEKSLGADINAAKKGDLGAIGDDALKAAVTAKLAEAKMPMQVTAKSGVVTLSGPGDMAAAEKIAKGVPGVQKVETSGGSAKTEAKK